MLLIVSFVIIFAELNKLIMKKLTQYSRLFTAILLFLLFMLQGIWLYKTFQLTKLNLKQEVEQEFIRATQKETDLKDRIRVDINVGQNFIFDHENVDISSFPVNIMILEALEFYKIPLSIHNIDSLLRNDLKRKKIDIDFVIKKINTTNIRSRQLRKSSLLKISDIPLRVDKSIVLRLYISHANWSIFYQMYSIILLSILLVLIIAIAIGWQYQYYKKEKTIIRFQKDHTETVVHNMATPLQTIQIINQALIKNKEQIETKKEEFLAAQARQINKLQNQVAKILLVSRGEHTKITLNLKQIDIQPLIQEICTSFKITQQKKVEIIPKFCLQQTTALVDVELFTDVINNLIENAEKYSGDNVTITIKCQCTSKELLIVVKDNGVGIAPKYQKNIFDKFNRGEAPFINTVKGFGIGLSFVKKVVEAHNGKVELFSKGRNKGTSVTICIPQ